MWRAAVAAVVVVTTSCHAAAPLGAVAPSPQVVAEPVRVRSGDVVLDGEIRWAAARERLPMVVIVHGTGRLDRDGNAPDMRCDTYKLWAMGLAERGIASLRYDKRGVGRSMADLPPELRTLDRLVDDVVAIVAHLRRDPRVGRITLLGHSEGSEVVVLAAPRAAPDALVLAAGAGRPLVDVVRAQLATQVDAAGLAAFERLVVDVRAGRPLVDVPPALEPLFRERSVPWLRSTLDEDPSAAARKVRVPTLILRGTYDAQVTAEDAARLRAAMPAARALDVPRANHLFKAEASAALPQASYTDPTRPLADGVIDAIVSGVAR